MFDGAIFEYVHSPSFTLSDTAGVAQSGSLFRSLEAELFDVTWIPGCSCGIIESPCELREEPGLCNLTSLCLSFTLVID